MPSSWLLNVVLFSNHYPFFMLPLHGSLNYIYDLYRSFYINQIFECELWTESKWKSVKLVSKIWIRIFRYATVKIAVWRFFFKASLAINLQIYGNVLLSVKKSDLCCTSKILCLVMNLTSLNISRLEAHHSIGTYYMWHIWPIRQNYENDREFPWGYWYNVDRKNQKGEKRKDNTLKKSLLRVKISR